jgi:hypothetical protein
MVTGHRVRADETGIESQRSRLGDDARLGAADISHEARASRGGRESPQHLRSLVHGDGEDDDIRAGAVEIDVERIADDPLANGGIETRAIGVIPANPNTSRREVARDRTAHQS